MALATRLIGIDSRTWEHRVIEWTHEVLMMHTSTNYRIEWPSGADDAGKLFIDQVAADSGHWFELVLSVHAKEGLPEPDEHRVGYGRYLVMFPFFRAEMTDDDHRQLMNEPPAWECPICGDQNCEGFCDDD